MCNFPEKLAAANHKTVELVEKIAGIQELYKRINSLEKALERELEWHPYESKFNVTQAEYAELTGCQAAERLPDGKVLDMIVREFGFEREKIIILHSVEQEEVNRHHRAVINNFA